jgi:hypothetical protein
MGFQKDNKLSPGGKKGNKGGRPSNQVKANEEEAKRLFRERLAASFEELLTLAKKVCRGVKRRKYCPKTEQVYYEMEYDTATLRFLIERFIPPAKTAMDLNVRDTPEEWYRAIQAAREAKAKK